MRVVAADLGLEKLWVVYPGTRAYPLDEGLEALPLTRAGEALRAQGII